MENSDHYIQFYTTDHPGAVPTPLLELVTLSYTFIDVKTFPLSFNSVSDTSGLNGHLAFLGYEKRMATLAGDLYKLEKVNSQINALLRPAWVEAESRLFYELKDLYDLTRTENQIVLFSAFTDYSSKFITLNKQAAPLQKEHTLTSTDKLFKLLLTPKADITIQEKIMLNNINEGLLLNNTILDKPKESSLVEGVVISAKSKQATQVKQVTTEHDRVLDIILEDLTKLVIPVAREASKCGCEFMLDRENLRTVFKLITRSLSKPNKETISMGLGPSTNIITPEVGIVERFILGAPDSLAELSLSKNILMGNEKYISFLFTNMIESVLDIELLKMPAIEKIIETSLGNTIKTEKAKTKYTSLGHSTQIEKDLSKFATFGRSFLTEFYFKSVSQLKEISAGTKSVKGIFLYDDASIKLAKDTIFTMHELSKLVDKLERDVTIKDGHTRTDRKPKDITTKLGHTKTDRFAKDITDFDLHFVNRDILATNSNLGKLLTGEKVNQKIVDLLLLNTTTRLDKILKELPINFVSKNKILDELSISFVSKNKIVDELKLATLLSDNYLSLSDIHKVQKNIHEYSHSNQLKALDSNSYLSLSDIQKTQKNIYEYSHSNQLKTLDLASSPITILDNTINVLRKLCEFGKLKNTINLEVLTKPYVAFLKASGYEAVYPQLTQLNSLLTVDNIATLLSIDSINLLDDEDNFLEVLDTIHLERNSQIKVDSLQTMNKSLVVDLIQTFSLIKENNIDLGKMKCMAKLNLINVGKIFKTEKDIDSSNITLLKIEQILKSDANDIVFMNALEFAKVIKSGYFQAEKILGTSSNDIKLDTRLVMVDEKESNEIVLRSRVYLSIHGKKHILIDTGISFAEAEQTICAYNEMKLVETKLKDVATQQKYGVEHALKDVRLGFKNGIYYIKKEKEGTTQFSNFLQIKSENVIIFNESVLLDKYSKTLELLNEFVYTEMYRRWYYMPDEGPVDWMILPMDYPYVTNPVNGYSQHPLPNGAELGQTEIPVSIYIISNFIDFCINLWDAHMELYTRFTPDQALKHFLNLLYDWVTTQAPDKIYRLPEYYPDSYTVQDSGGSAREDYFRVYRWIRWYTEALVMNIPIEDVNIDGNIYIQSLIQDLANYYHNHHGVYKSPHTPGNTVIDKVKGVRHRWVEINKKLT